VFAAKATPLSKSDDAGNVTCVSRGAEEGEHDRQTLGPTNVLDYEIAGADAVLTVQPSIECCRDLSKVKRIEHAWVHTGMVFNEGDGELAISGPHKFNHTTHNVADKSRPEANLLAEIDTLSHKSPRRNDMHNDAVTYEGNTCAKPTSNDHASRDGRQGRNSNGAGTAHDEISMRGYTRKINGESGYRLEHLEGGGVKSMLRRRGSGSVVHH